MTLLFDIAEEITLSPEEIKALDNIKAKYEFHNSWKSIIYSMNNDVKLKYLKAYYIAQDAEKQTAILEYLSTK